MLSFQAVTVRSQIYPMRIGIYTYGIICVRCYNKKTKRIYRNIQTDKKRRQLSLILEGVRTVATRYPTTRHESSKIICKNKRYCVDSMS